MDRRGVRGIVSSSARHSEDGGAEQVDGPVSTGSTVQKDVEQETVIQTEEGGKIRKCINEERGRHVTFVSSFRYDFRGILERPTDRPVRGSPGPKDMMRGRRLRRSERVGMQTGSRGEGEGEGEERERRGRGRGSIQADERKGGKAGPNGTPER